MVNTGVDGIQAVSLRCRSWGCPLCHDARRSQLIALAKSGDPNTFITLTVNPAFRATPYARARALADSWRIIVRFLKRRCGPCLKAHRDRWPVDHESQPFQGRHLEDGTRCCYGYAELPYFCVFEATLKGEPHLHILCRVKWISQQWLSKQMNLLMMAPVVDIRRVRDKTKLAFYISKYCGKAPHRFLTCKRYWTTRDYELTKFVPTPPPGRWHNRWVLVRVSLSQLVEDWRAEGRHVDVSKHRILAYSEGPPDDVLAEIDYIMARRRRGKVW